MARLRSRGLLLLSLVLPVWLVVAPDRAAAADPVVVLVFDGQSNSRKPGPPHSYPYVVRGWGYPDAPSAIVAMGGTSYAERTADAATRVDPFAEQGDLQALFTEGGQQDIAFDQVSGWTLFWRVAEYVDGRRAAGYDFVTAMTLPPSLWFTPAMELERVRFNEYLRQHHELIGVDVLVDVAADPRLQDPSDTAYYSDGTHYTAQTAFIVGQLTLAALRADAAAGATS